MKKHKTVLRKEVYDKYVAPVKEMDRQRKINRRKEWWSKNIFNVITVAIAVLSLIVSAISLVKS